MELSYMKVLMFNGSSKNIQDLVLGDILMGDDSKPRYVIRNDKLLTNLYEIKPPYGNAITIDESYFLSLKLSKSPYIQHDSKKKSFTIQYFDIDGKVKCLTFSYRFKDKTLVEQEANRISMLLPQTGNAVEVKLYDFLTSTSGWKAGYKGYKIGIDFPKRDVDLDPYFIGMWLGDGTASCAEITTVDSEIINYLKLEFSDLIVKPRAQNAISYRITTGIRGATNRVLEGLRKYNLIKNKHIPLDYLFNDRKSRLRLLAGLLDTDGYYMDTNCYEITQKRVILANEIIFLARSLGFRATITPTLKYCIYKGEKREGIYQRMHISGDLEEIPVILERKKARAKIQMRNHLAYEIEIINRGQGLSYQLEVDGNGKFLLEDFTVISSSRSYEKTIHQNPLSLDQRIYVMIGLLGSGKTTYVDNLKITNPDLAIIDGDSLTTTDKIINSLIKFLNFGFNVIIDAHNGSLDHRRSLINEARKRNIKIFGFYFNVNVETCKTRCKIREEKGGKKVADFTFNRIRKSFRSPILEEGFTGLVVIE